MVVSVRDLVSRLVSSTTAPAFAVNDEQHFTCWNDEVAELLLRLRPNFYDLPCYAGIKGRTVDGAPFCRPDCWVIQLGRTSGKVPETSILIKGRGGLSLKATISFLVAQAGTDEAQTIHILSILPAAPFEADANTDSHSEAGGASAPATAERLRGLARLTKRQQEVLSLLSAGFNTKAIAQMLKITPATAKTHVDHILRNLGVHSRVEAALYGILFHASSSP